MLNHSKMESKSSIYQSTDSNLKHNFRIFAVTVAVPCNVKDKEDGFEIDVSKLPQ
jgi:hypothetical protein